MKRGGGGKKRYQKRRSVDSRGRPLGSGGASHRTTFFGVPCQWLTFLWKIGWLVWYSSTSHFFRMMISRNWFWMIYFKLYKLSTESVDGSLMKLSLAVVKVADDVRGHSTDSLIHKDHVDVVTVALIHFVALIHGWFTADSLIHTDFVALIHTDSFCGLDSHWFTDSGCCFVVLIHWFRMLFLWPWFTDRGWCRETVTTLTTALSLLTGDLIWSSDLDHQYFRFVWIFIIFYARHRFFLQQFLES